ncbi:MAG: hypothetical protein IT395_05200 [Candidatus Omnitrophica bacterium]|nr:hypothetical protein [Candidatus Omnitrophota bacterium]
MKNTPYLLTFWASLVLMVVCLGGCSTITNFQNSQKQKREAVEQKKEYYMALKRDMANNTLRKGVTVETLKEKYGAPDNIFYSGSSVSSFQVWTYDVFKDQLADTKLTSIILYIENDKLVNWKY